MYFPSPSPYFYTPQSFSAPSQIAAPHPTELPRATTASSSTARGRKRKAGDENQDPALQEEDAHLPKKRKNAPRRETPEKLAHVFAALKDVRWNLSEFLYYAFQFKDDGIQHRTTSHAAYIQHFLHGRSSYTPATIIDIWFRHPDGRVPADSDDIAYMYSTSVPFMDIKPVRPALSAFAAQLVRDKLVSEADAAIKPENGLHASRIIRRHQPLTWGYILAICERSQAKRPARNKRPANIVAVNTISSLNFSRSNRANLFPLAHGLLYFSLSAPFDLFHHNSRIGMMPAYNTIYKALEDLAAHEAMVVEALGRDDKRAGTIWCDNVQNYLRQRDARIGRENVLNIGIAATYVEAPECDLKALDVDDKRRRITENRRAGLSVEILLDWIDQEHRETVGMLQWLRTLTNYVPQLVRYKERVSVLYRTRGAKRPLPVRASTVHPLPTSGKNETVTTELKDALVDFWSQLGQHPKEHLRALQLIGGDGLTYEKLVQLKCYMQFHPDEFESFELVEPVLAAWHTGWTDLSRLVETHWGPQLSKNPATLGHSAAKIDRPTPSNLKKVDYNAGTDLVYVVLDARMLDCWRLHFEQEDLFEYFQGLAERSELPSLEVLEDGARQLYRAYSSFRAAERALCADTLTTGSPSSWEHVVPLGSAWTPTPVTASAPSATLSAQNTDTGEKKPEVFKGDRVLAQSITFMRDASVSREFAYSVAEGDVGRVYEAMKVMLFTFAGSSHTKYTAYLLEMITNLEMESSPELHNAILDSLLINLSGQPGHFIAGDLMQEYFNRLLQVIVERKGTEYGAHFVRNIVSPNLHHMARLQDDLKEGLGLAVRSGRHSEPHKRSEIRRLTLEYRTQQLHCRRPGRVIDGDTRDVDDYARGVGKLYGGKLQKWVKETSYLRGPRGREHAEEAVRSRVEHSTLAGATAETGDDDEAEEGDDDDSDGARGSIGSQLTSMYVVDGELMSQTLDVDVQALAALAELEDDDNELGDDDLVEVDATAAQMSADHDAAAV
ncbi:hypothetical protein B0H21DRAFT_813891 [Amylocystis lapponica]|nr:hypothetical protein B0H21DRAFT_813891 [Amylocystis lapponica]